MARDTVLFIRALGFERVDLLGLSMGGFIAQVIAAEEPDLVRKVILAGSGPASGPGIDGVTSVTVQDMLKATLRRKDPKHYLFFTQTEGRQRAAREFLARLKERTDDRDKAISVPSFRAQLKASKRWGRTAPQDLSRIQQPVLVANGESDRMDSSVNTIDLGARLLPRRRTRQDLPAPRQIRPAGARVPETVAISQTAQGPYTGGRGRSGLILRVYRSNRARATRRASPAGRAITRDRRLAKPAILSAIGSPPPRPARTSTAQPHNQRAATE
ncbi:alpha/beta fold hydrolase [Streptomyces microflavus]|uniref:alpha/beta fold hydrolase n=1 Tax=Streptomyces microflavus TaxID=1919 RepID=UPI003B222CC6